MTKSADRVNAIADTVGAQSYLEIGIEKGLTFHAVNINRKVAVDPQFKFAEREDAPNVQYFEISSNQFFSGNFAREI